jgi:hypothetical protein
MQESITKIFEIFEGTPLKTRPQKPQILPDVHRPNFHPIGP